MKEIIDDQDDDMMIMSDYDNDFDYDNDLMKINVVNYIHLSSEYYYSVYILRIAWDCCIKLACKFCL